MSHLAPQLANQELFNRISELRQLIQGQESTITELRKSPAPAQGHGQGESEKNAEDLVQCAREVVTSGKSLYEGSVAGRSIFGSNVAAPTTGALCATTLSEDAMAARRERVTDRFFDQTDTSESTQHSVSSMVDDILTALTKPSTINSDGSGVTKRGKQDSWDGAHGSEDEIEIELLQNAISAAQTAYSNDNYSAARPKLLASLELIQGLPLKQHPSVDEVFWLKYQLTMCSFHLDDRPEVERVLHEVLLHSPTSDSQRQKLFHISHLLAQIYASGKKLELARLSCSQALRGRRMLLGKENHEYFSSLALMHRIYELQGNKPRAQEYLELIPGPARDGLLSSYRYLSSDDPDAFRTRSHRLLVPPSIPEQDRVQQGARKSKDYLRSRNTRQRKHRIFSCRCTPTAKRECILAVTLGDSPFE